MTSHQPTQRSRAILAVLNVLAVLLSLPITFAIIFAGGMAGDSSTSGTSAATYVIIGFGILYFVSTLFCVVRSQVKRSLKWAIVPLVLPAAFIALSFIVSFFGIIWLRAHGITD